MQMQFVLGRLLQVAQPPQLWKRQCHADASQQQWKYPYAHQNDNEYPTFEPILTKKLHVKTFTLSSLVQRPQFGAYFPIVAFCIVGAADTGIARLT
jgi:hypothetical protein